MIVSIEESVFNQYDSKPTEIINLFSFGLECRHYILTRPVFDETDQDSLINAWLNRLDPPILKDQFGHVLKTGIEGVVKEPFLDLTIHTVAGNESNWNETPPKLTLSDTCQILNQPLRIILENSRNDLAFLKCILPREWEEKLSECVEKKWVEPFNAGGIGEMKEQVMLFYDQHKEILRSWLLFDSDAKKPGCPSETSKALGSVCENYGFAYHQLKRRAIENYIPVKAIFAWIYHSNRIRKLHKERAKTFKELRSEQRHHYDMKHGLEKDEKSGGSPLFQDIDPKSRQHLLTGFGNIAELFKQSNFDIQYEWLLKDGQDSEIQEIIQSLFKRM